MSVKLLPEYNLEFLSLGGLPRLFWLYTCQNTMLLKVTCRGSYVLCQIVKTLIKWMLHFISLHYLLMTKTIFREKKHYYLSHEARNPVFGVSDTTLLSYSSKLTTKVKFSLQQVLIQFCWGYIPNFYIPRHSKLKMKKKYIENRCPPQNLPGSPEWGQDVYDVINAYIRDNLHFVLISIRTWKFCT